MSKIAVSWKNRINYSSRKRPKRRLVFTATQTNLLHSEESFVFVCPKDVLSISNEGNLQKENMLFILFIDVFNVSIPPRVPLGCLWYNWVTSVSNFAQTGKIFPVLVSIQTFLNKHKGNIYLIFQYVVRISHASYSRAKRWILIDRTWGGWRPPIARYELYKIKIKTNYLCNYN